MPHSPLLSQFKDRFKQQGKPILDLACGRGRNGLYLHQQHFPVQFADKNSGLLEQLQQQHNIQGQDCYPVDFETGAQHLVANSFQAILVFRYLHRPLMAQIKAAIEPGGFLIYETFTTQNRQFGRPNRDEFLLQPNELQEIFQDWHCLFYFEGIKVGPDRAIAQIVCQKPIQAI
ncbi:type 12 methyltransferase [Psychromonas marina]|uniref:Type 12 methyltransferase n=1 Tax=Psychromonas marina TaxID=88364 RepID=A0ABQ6DYU1_9GAMM|nr:methyltransferase domain-containing protein [Psychromonas marina]GLS90265.1 type 12 methyltransferase [Psychromonas marina]